MALNDYAGDDGGSGTTETRTTYFQFENPNHPDSKEFSDPEQAQKHFEAARFIQGKMGTKRIDLVGDFLWGVYQFEENDDPEPLKELVQELTQ